MAGKTKQDDGRKNNGRPRAPIDWQKVDQALMAGCNGVQVAAKLGIHPETLYKSVQRDFKMGFSEYEAAKKAKGDALLCELQFDKAVKGDTTMQIWLGKQRLGQSDKRETKTELKASIATDYADLVSECNKEG